MAQKPNHASGYGPAQVEHVRATCLYIATKLGDFLDEIVIVGGLVPSLLIEQAAVTVPDDRHVGTLDLDVGLALAILDDGRYQALTERLRQAGFSEDVNDDGKPTRQRWKIDGPPKVTVDFGLLGGRLRRRSAGRALRQGCRRRRAGSRRSQPRPRLCRRLQAWLTLRRAACSQRSKNAAGSRAAASMRACSSSIDWAGGVAGEPSCAETPPPGRAR